MATILLVDDSRLSRRMAADAIVAAGHDVIEASDGEQGLAMLREHNPDCVVLDLLMPCLDGHGFLRQARQSGCTTPIIVQTADIQDGSRAECEALGIAGFLNKPVKREALLNCVTHALLQSEGATR